MQLPASVGEHYSTPITLYDTSLNPLGEGGAMFSDKAVRTFYERHYCQFFLRVVGGYGRTSGRIKSCAP